MTNIARTGWLATIVILLFSFCIEGGPNWRRLQSPQPRDPG